jgi:hypothetical protein
MKELPSHWFLSHGWLPWHQIVYSLESLNSHSLVAQVQLVPLLTVIWLVPQTYLHTWVPSWLRTGQDVPAWILSASRESLMT